MRKEWFLNENIMSRLEIPWVLHNTDFYVCKVTYSEVPIIATSDYTCSGFCKKSYHLLISPPPTNLPNTLKIYTGENEIDR